MSLKIKPTRPKIRRRGARLITTIKDERLVYTIYGDGMRVVEASKTGLHFHVTYSKCGIYALLKGHEDNEAIQYVVEGGFFGKRIVAFRSDDTDSWIFRDPDTREMFISTMDTGIKNVALVASTVVAEMDPALAAFLAVSPLLCRIDDVDEIHTNPRYAALRKFAFEFTPPPEAIGAGRRAENTVRHQYTNYDDMLRAAGGLLHPEQYERVRKGVDMLVGSCMRKSASGSSG